MNPDLELLRRTLRRNFGSSGSWGPGDEPLGPDLTDDALRTRDLEAVKQAWDAVRRLRRAELDPDERREVEDLADQLQELPIFREWQNQGREETERTRTEQAEQAQAEREANPREVVIVDPNTGIPTVVTTTDDLTSPEGMEAFFDQYGLGEQERQALGNLPQGFTATRTTQVQAPFPRGLDPGQDTVGVQRDVPPTFFDGDQYLPATASAEQRARLQRRLVQAGLLEEGTFLPGVWDASTLNAYSGLLIYANQTGHTDLETALDEHRAGYRRLRRRAEREALEGFEPTTQLTPDYASLRETVREWFSTNLRREPQPEELERFASMLQSEWQASAAQQQTMEREAFATNIAQQFGRPTDKPDIVEQVDPVSRVTEELRRRYQPEVARATRVNDAANSRVSIMDSIINSDSVMGRT